MGPLDLKKHGRGYLMEDPFKDDRWFLIEPVGEDILQISEVDEEGEPFDTLDAKFTVYYKERLDLLG